MKEETKAAPPARRPELVKVRTVRREGVAVLVEWYTGDKKDPQYHRGCVPPEEIQFDTADKLVLDAAIPWGVPWDEVVPGVTPAVTNELRRHGIWTADDLLANAGKISLALQRSILLPLVNALKTFARNERKKQINQEDI